ncbi:MAG TPA: Mur ligase family protein [Thermoanaerobaculia bacterium]|nr:Mur ligase family protein [Thermoanaerobaculia bacterium]
MSESPLSIHLIAIGGTGMAPLACLLQDLGHRVRGSDQPLYPPMSTLLADCGIDPLVGYDPAHLDPQPDLVIVGNAVTRTNAEAVEAERRGLPIVSMPQALYRYLLAGRRPLVVAGTHGKTTTTSLAAWVLTDCGADPGYLIGGVPKDLGRSFRRGGGDRFVVEGDEYNAAYFDRNPKFLHYRPETLILTSAEYDHADLYGSPADLLSVYGRLLETVPPEGLAILHGDSQELRALAGRARCRVLFYGLGADSDLRPAAPPEPVAGGGSRFRIDDAEGGEVEVEIRLSGRHNVLNALAVWAAARHDGQPAEAVARALGRFSGVRRRQDELGTESGVTVMDDFAHHPTAVSETLRGLRSRYGGRRLVVLFEPRSLTAGRSFFQEPYRDAFAKADRVLLAPIFYRERFAEADRLDLPRLARELTEHGTPTTACASSEEVFETALAEVQPGDVVVTMSSGSFDGMAARVLAALGEREAAAV